MPNTPTDNHNPYLTEEGLAELDALCNAATPEPWEFRPGHSKGGDSIDLLMAEVGVSDPNEEPEYAEVFFDTQTLGEREVSINWEIARTARNAAPLLIAAVRTLQQENAALHKTLAGDFNMKTFRKMCAERDALRQENEQLLAALKNTKATIYGEHGKPSLLGHGHNARYDCRFIAKWHTDPNCKVEETAKHAEELLLEVHQMTVKMAQEIDAALAPQAPVKEEKP